MCFHRFFLFVYICLTISLGPFKGHLWVSEDTFDGKNCTRFGHEKWSFFQAHVIFVCMSAWIDMHEKLNLAKGLILGLCGRWRRHMEGPGIEREGWPGCGPKVINEGLETCQSRSLWHNQQKRGTSSWWNMILRENSNPVINGGKEPGWAWEVIWSRGAWIDIMIR